jgi:hypothetical protein
MCILFVQASYSQPGGGFFFENICRVRRVAADF